MAGNDREGNARVAPRVAIVSTSINPTPTAYTQWASQGDLIVAGDLNSPHELRDFIESIGGEYVSPDEQTHWEFSKDIGWSTIQRRNVAVMMAYARKYDYVITVDDDNHTHPGWVAAHVAHLRGELPGTTVYASGDSGWVNHGLFVAPPHNQRGVPLGTTRFHTLTGLPKELERSIVVSTAQVLGDPDCDAVTRLVHKPKVERLTSNVVISLDDWTAFNSQATAWDGSWAPLIACLPHVGRYDDIIASFIAKRIMRAFGKTLFVGEPCVTQVRNEHDIVKDLSNEYYGMSATPYIIRALEDDPLSSTISLVEAYEQCIQLLSWHNALPPATLTFMRHWSKTWCDYQWGK